MSRILDPFSSDNELQPIHLEKGSPHVFTAARSLSATLPFMNRETLLEELNRLLDAGEPLLDVFPKMYPDYWWLELPDKISPEMRRYADSVALRAWDREEYQGFCQQETTDYLAAWVKECDAGLLGWRAIGVLK